MDVLDDSDDAVAHERAQLAPCGVLSELEVHEVRDPGRGREVVHVLCISEATAEGFVAEHCVATLDGAADMVAVQERWRVH